MIGEEKIELLRSALTLAANQLRFTAESVTHDGSSSALYRRRNAIMADANAAFAVLETISQAQEKE